MVQPQRKVSRQKPAAAKAASRDTEQNAAAPKRYTPLPNWLCGLHSILLWLDMRCSAGPVRRQPLLLRSRVHGRHVQSQSVLVSDGGRDCLACPGGALASGVSWCVLQHRTP